MKTTLETPKESHSPSYRLHPVCKGCWAEEGRAFKRLGINTIEDVLTHLPRRYEDREISKKKISQIKYGEIETISGIVKAAGINVTNEKKDEDL